MSEDTVRVAGVRLTHPDRVMYPEQGVTKADVARYYERVADRILPHLTDRPLSLVRCPSGRQKECFYQKHLGDTRPEAVRTVLIQEKSAKRPYSVVDDLEGLVSLVQIGVLEIHPWGSRTDRLERPDRLIFDLDPGQGTGWNDVVRAARRLHELLDELGLESFVKVSGGKGLHVVVPLVRRSEWDDVRSFAKACADLMADEEPDRYVATMSKEKRKGRIFVDYLRNSRGATSVAAYSTRARFGAPVSLPVRWDEIGRLDGGDPWAVGAVSRRLSALRRDPWEGFFDIRQSITEKMRRAVGV